LVQLEEDKRDLERQLRETKANSEAAEKKLNEQRQVEERKHMEEINFLKKTNQQLKVCFKSKNNFNFLCFYFLGSIRRINCTEKINYSDKSILLYTLLLIKTKPTLILCVTFPHYFLFLFK
jgi:hypothetical protein